MSIIYALSLAPSWVDCKNHHCCTWMLGSLSKYAKSRAFAELSIGVLGDTKRSKSTEHPSGMNSWKGRLQDSNALVVLRG